MDAIEYDRIADLLMQMRAKYKILDSNNAEIDKRIKLVTYYLEQCIILNDHIAVKDGKGLI